MQARINSLFILVVLFLPSHLQGQPAPTTPAGPPANSTTFTNRQADLRRRFRQRTNQVTQGAATNSIPVPGVPGAMTEPPGVTQSTLPPGTNVAPINATNVVATEAPAPTPETADLPTSPAANPVIINNPETVVTTQPNLPAAPVVPVPLPAPQTRITPRRGVTNVVPNIPPRTIATPAPAPADASQSHD